MRHLSAAEVSYDDDTHADTPRLFRMRKLSLSLVVRHQMYTLLILIPPADPLRPNQSRSPKLPRSPRQDHHR